MKEEKEVSMERVLEINAGLNLITNNETCPRVLSFKIGIFKANVEIFVKQYQKEIDKLNTDYKQYLKTEKVPNAEGKIVTIKKLPDSKKDEMKEETEKLNKTKADLKLEHFKLSDFEDVEGITPTFYMLMNDLIEK